ncbi:DUF2254 domain-containing protein [Tautonia plasticadhaerens]|uniref:DUF2254 domain-containing protein n=1 Tax=Tautonia plasticadhaerens TaxID=2527974 RepID=A0A518H347_9BACT|nr:DUF2254 domain-containing protein [Tautonia plasticadhaerens]QDV35269.1 hypothetical protein ElP_31720 [Tautonia plasticadhaerens]
MSRISRPPRFRYPAGPARLRYHWDWLRSGYLFVPSVMVLVAVGLAFAAIEVDIFLTRGTREVSAWYARGGPDEARTILGMIAGSMITIVGIVYSIAMVNLTLASDQFGPRLIRTFMTDVGTQVVLGAFLATFVFSVVVLLAIESGSNAQEVSGPPSARTGEAGAPVPLGMPEQTDFAPVVSLWGGVGLALICLALLIYFIHHVAQAIQAPNVIDSVARELERSIRRHFPEERGPIEPLSPASERDDPGRDLPPHFEEEASPILAVNSGYLQVIDHETLLDFCAERDLVARLEYRPGDFVIAGGTLATAWPADRLDEEARRRLRGTFLLGVQRTPPEDVEFSISQLVEVAIRALANNDPFTAINCVDRLGSAMCLLAGRKMPPRRRYDAEGRLRAIVRSTRFGGIINTAFDQIRQYGLGNAALTIRLLEVIALIGSRVDNLTDGASLLRQAVMIERGSRRVIEEEYDLRDIADRFQDILHQLGLSEVAEAAGHSDPLQIDFG